MTDNISAFGFENIKDGMFEKYKAKENQIDRVAIVCTDSRAMFVGTKVHSKDRDFLCMKGKCCEILGPSKWCIGTVLIQYATDKQGNLKKPFCFELLPWIFGEATFSNLKTMNSEFPLASHDIQISCENEDYQHLNILPCNESIWTAKDELKNLILEQANPIWGHVKKFITSDVSVEEVGNLPATGESSGDNDSSATIDPT
jgi:hypothetical protein